MRRSDPLNDDDHGRFEAFSHINDLSGLLRWTLRRFHYVDMR